MGILGLALENDARSIVRALKEQGVISSMVVAINYEDPLDKHTQSMISFGHVDYSIVAGGEGKTIFYSNMGFKKWGLKMDSFSYDGIDMTNNQTSKIALIDSGNFSI